MLYSIVTVVFNDLAGLKRTWNSIASQELNDWEWVIVDGASTDGTTSFLETGDPSWRWRSEPDQGIYDAMNKGISMSRGEYIVFLNAGDIFASVSVLTDVRDELVSAKEEVDVLFGGATLVFRNGQRKYRGPKALRNYIWHGLPAIHQSTYYRTDLLRSNLYDVRYKVCGDYYLAARLYLQKIRVAYIREALAEFFVGGSSYQKRQKLFLEPFQIQRDVLNVGLLVRILSLVRRAISTAGFVLLNWLPVRQQLKR